MSDFYERSLAGSDLTGEQAGTDQIKQALLASFTRSLQDKSYPRVADLRDATGNRIPRDITPMGEIVVLDAEVNSHTMLQVATDSGAVISGTRELLTNELTGCLAVFIFGRNQAGDVVSGLFHLTPTSRLSWGNYHWNKDDRLWGSEQRQHTADQIVSALATLGTNPTATTLFFVGNRGSEPDALLPDYGYSEIELERKRKELAGFIRSHGYGVNIAAPLEFSTCSLYWTPTQTDKILAVGERDGAKSPDTFTLTISGT